METVVVWKEVVLVIDEVLMVVLLVAEVLLVAV